jgi:hypothetical protein
VSLTRSLFHLAWCAGRIAFALAMVPRRHRRRAAALSLVPLLLVLTLYLKNWVVFGRFTSSTWDGMSVAKLTVQRAPLELRRALVRDGVLTPLALHEPYQPLSAYPESFSTEHVPSIPVLERRLKAAGDPNLNHFAYVEISTQFRRDAGALLVERPEIYLESVRRAFAIYAQPASHSHLLRGNRAQLAPYDDGFNRWALGALRAPPASAPCADIEDDDCLRRGAVYVWMAIALVGTLGGLGYGLSGLCRSRRSGRVAGGNGSHAAAAATLLFLSINVAYVSVIGNLVELGENNRFRFEIDALILVLAAALVAAWRRRRRSASTHAARVDERGQATKLISRPGT